MENLDFLFEIGPIREAMIIYLNTRYEEAADLSVDSMKAEYRRMERENDFHSFFEAVQLQNRIEHGAN